eukprot:5351674-Pleurochrysis_carterae.AAC.1
MRTAKNISTDAAAPGSNKRAEESGNKREAPVTQERSISDKTCGIGVEIIAQRRDGEMKRTATTVATKYALATFESHQRHDLYLRFKSPFSILAQSTI